MIAIPTLVLVASLAVLVWILVGHDATSSATKVRTDRSGRSTAPSSKPDAAQVPSTSTSTTSTAPTAGSGLNQVPALPPLQGTTTPTSGSGSSGSGSSGSGSSGGGSGSGSGSSTGLTTSYCDDPASAAYPSTTWAPASACPNQPPDGVPSGTEMTLDPDEYVAVLDSKAFDNVAGVNQSLNKAVTAGLDAGWVDTRRYAGLRDPYFAVVVGSFGTKADVDAFCTSHKYITGSCYARNTSTPTT
jgi:hypothetical protein